MVLPEEFKKKVLKAFDGDKKIEFEMEMCPEGLGLILDPAKFRGFSADTILEAKSLRELKVRALKQKQREELYREFQKLYAEERKHMPPRI